MLEIVSIINNIDYLIILCQYCNKQAVHVMMNNKFKTDIRCLTFVILHALVENRRHSYQGPAT